jgi:hypothetical protein
VDELDTSDPLRAAIRGAPMHLSQALGMLETAAEGKEWERYRLATLVVASLLDDRDMQQARRDLVAEVWDGIMRSGDAEAIAFGRWILGGPRSVRQQPDIARIVEAVQLGAMQCI